MNRRFVVILFTIFLMLWTLAFSKESLTRKTVKGREVPSTQLERTDAFYDSLKATAGRNWFLKNLYPIVFSADSVEATVHTDDQTFERWKGKVINSINIEFVEVFPPDNSDLEKPAYSFVKNVGNGLHINTREWVIRGNLLFHEGDHLSPKVLRRNIAYLRNLNYLSEVRIFVISRKDKQDSVDILIVVQDKFSISMKGQFTSLSKFSFKIDDQNLLGLGNQLKNEWSVDPQHQNSIGWESYYRSRNIYRTFISGDLGYSDLPGYNLKSAGLSRPFLFPVLKIAGGITINETYVRAPVDTIAVKRIELGGWGGYCVKGNPGPANQYAYTALALKQTWFRKRPEVGPTYGKLWHESLLAIGSLGITQSEYKRLPFMYSFLENEDIPVGFLFEFLFGYDFGEYRNREFLGLHGAKGVALNNSGFLYLKGGIETFISKDGTEQGMCLFEPLYITPLKKIGKFHTRTFFRERIILGNKRFPGETLKLSTDNYFRGKPDMAGNNLITSGLESDFVAPWDVIGFKIAFFGFIDGAMVTDSLSHANSGDLLLTEGIGFRIRNPHIVWKSLEFSVALNHRKGHHVSPEFAIVAKVPLKMLDFEGRKPEPYLFK